MIRDEREPAVRIGDVEIVPIVRVRADAAWTWGCVTAVAWKVPIALEIRQPGRATRTVRLEAEIRARPAE